MFKKFIPFAHAQSIYEIDFDFFKRHGVKTLFIVLDNTLDSYKAHEPKKHTVDFIKKLKANGIEPVIISNNKPHRVCGFADKAGISYLASARKPGAKRLKQEIARRGLQNDEVMLVGDQMMTDVLAARKAGIRVVLTEKVVAEDQWTTHINRLFDRPIRKYHRKKGNLKNWRNV